MALEAQYEWLNEFVVTQTNDAIYESTTVAEFRPQTVTANLKLILPLGRVEPHLILGIGLGLWEGKGDPFRIFKKRLGFGRASGGRHGLPSDTVLDPECKRYGGARDGSIRRKKQASIPFSVRDLYYVSFAAGVAYRF